MTIEVERHKIKTCL